ncbi:uncharacterized protein LOC112454082 [Temnothorax curvispinosus]|uniref:Uncharacterized protein LOC112454082 n=1 Tax=Temnothorax curvispinosus TaxID=300111 RepID=A0A6J1PPQ1_9HYME|nr:uncharacterized protein LOC112454082 [Temnothorax curvispinosus]
MNLSKVSLDLNIWQQFMDVIIKYSTSNTRHDEVNLMLEKLKDKDISTDTKVAVGLMLLPHLIPPKGLKKYKGKCYKPSIANAKESLIKHASIPGDMTLIKQEARKHAEMLKITLQQYIIVLGSPYEIKESYVQVDDILYKTNSTLEAIDICFKTFHVFQVNYPIMSEHLWMLIQKGIYNFTTKWDSIIPNIEHVLSKVSKSFEKSVNSDTITV